MESGRHKLLTAEEEVALARLAAQGDLEARDRMILSNNRLVWKIAKKYQSSRVEVEDLVQEGTIGLVHAVKKFNPELGFRFSTYATQWITQYILICISRTSGNIRSTNTNHWKQRKYKVTFDQLQRDLGRNPTDSEMATALQVTKGGLDCVRKAMLAHDRGCGSSQDAVMKGPSPLEICEQQELIDRVGSDIQRLDERDGNIIRKRFGIGTNIKLTFKELGIEYGLSRERIRQIEQDALGKLRKMLTS